MTRSTAPGATRAPLFGAVGRGRGTAHAHLHAHAHAVHAELANQLLPESWHARTGHSDSFHRHSRACRRASTSAHAGRLGWACRRQLMGQATRPRPNPTPTLAAARPRCCRPWRRPRSAHGGSCPDPARILPGPEPWPRPAPRGTHATAGPRTRARGGGNGQSSAARGGQARGGQAPQPEDTSA